MKRYNVLLLVSVLVLIVLTTGCPPGPVEVLVGDLEVVVRSSAEAQGFMGLVDEFVVEVLGLGSRESVTIGHNTGDWSSASRLRVPFLELDPGSYTITVLAKNSQGHTLLSAQVGATVAADTTVRAEVEIAPIHAELTIDLDTSALSTYSYCKITGVSPSDSFYVPSTTQSTIAKSLTYGLWDIQAEAFDSQDHSLEILSTQITVHDTSAQQYTFTFNPQVTPKGTLLVSWNPDRATAAQVSTYDVRLDDTTDDSFLLYPGNPKGTLFSREIPEGSWDITITAKNSQNVSVGSGSSSNTVITANTTTTRTIAVAAPKTTVTLNPQPDASVPAVDHYTLFGSSPYDYISLDTLQSGESTALSRGLWNFTLRAKDAQENTLAESTAVLTLGESPETLTIPLQNTGKLRLQLAPDTLVAARAATYRITPVGAHFTPEATVLNGTTVTEITLPVDTYGITVNAYNAAGSPVALSAQQSNLQVVKDQLLDTTVTLTTPTAAITLTPQPEAAIASLIDHYSFTGVSTHTAFTTTLEASAQPLEITRDLVQDTWTVTCTALSAQEETLALGTLNLNVTAVDSKALPLTTVVDKGTLTLQLRPDTILANRTDHYSLTLTGGDNQETHNVSSLTGNLYTRELTKGTWNLSAAALDAGGNILSKPSDVPPIAVELKKTTLATVPLSAKTHTLTLNMDTGSLAETPAYYAISGASEWELFEAAHHTGSSFTKALTPGDWTITITAYTNSDLEIGEKTLQLTLAASDVVQAPVLNPIAHTGNLFILLDPDDYTASQSTRYEITAVKDSQQKNGSTTANSLTLSNLDIGTWQLTVTAKNSSNDTLATQSLSATVVENSTKTYTAALNAQRSDLQLGVTFTSVPESTTLTLLGYSATDAFIAEQLAPPQDITANPIKNYSYPQKLTPGDWHFIALSYDTYGVPVGTARTNENSPLPCDGQTPVTANLTLSEVETNSQPKGLTITGSETTRGTLTTLVPLQPISRLVPVTDPDPVSILVVKHLIWEPLAEHADHWSLTLSQGSSISYTRTNLTDQTFVEPEATPGTYTLSTTWYTAEGTELASAQTEITLIANDITYSELQALPPLGTLQLTPELTQELQDDTASYTLHLQKAETANTYGPTELFFEYPAVPGVPGSSHLETQTLENLLPGTWNLELKAYTSDGKKTASATASLALQDGQTTQKELLLTPVTTTVHLQIDKDPGFSAAIDHYTITCTDLQREQDPQGDTGWETITYTATTPNSTRQLPFGLWNIAVTGHTTAEAGAVTLSEPWSTTRACTTGGELVVLATLEPLTHTIALTYPLPQGLQADHYTILGTSADNLLLVQDYRETTWNGTLTPGTWDFTITSHTSTGEKQARGSATFSVTAETPAQSIPLQLLTGNAHIHLAKAGNFTLPVAYWRVEGTAGHTTAYNFSDTRTNLELYTKALPADTWTITARGYSAQNQPLSQPAETTIQISQDSDTLAQLTLEPVTATLTLQNTTLPQLSQTITTYRVFCSSDSAVITWSGTALSDFSTQLLPGSWTLTIEAYDAEEILRARNTVTQLNSLSTPLDPDITLEEVIYTGTLFADITLSDYIAEHADSLTLLASHPLYGTVERELDETFARLDLRAGTWTLTLQALDEYGTQLAAATAPVQILTGKTTYTTLALKEAQANLTVTATPDDTLLPLIANYSFLLVGPDTVHTNTQTSNVYAAGEVTPGTWQLTASARNTAGIILAEAQKSMVLEPNDIELAELNLVTRTGNLMVQLQPDATVLALADHYTITLSTSSGTTSKTGLTTLATTFPALPVGSYQISATAFRADNSLLGYGESDAPATVLPNTTILQELPVTLDEQALGNVTVNLTIPEAATAVSANLIDGSGTITPLTLTGSGTTRQAQVQDLLPGYYLLSVTITDAYDFTSTATATMAISGGETTTVDLTATFAAGTLQLSLLDPQIPNMVVTLSGIQPFASYAHTETLTVSVVTSPAAGQMIWYLNGLQLAETGDTLTLSNLAQDTYQLTCIATQATGDAMGNQPLLGSASITFTITE